nr:MAG TPA: hypothetical protein [Bacteriophage sp.]
MRIDLYPRPIATESGELVFNPIKDNKLHSIPIISNNGSFHGTFTTEA